MKKLHFVFPLVLISLVFMGCPYESKVPIGPADTKVNSDYFGNWMSNSESSGTSGNYKVSKEDKFTYKVEEIKEKEEKSEEGEATEPVKPVVYIGHITMVNDIPFVNLYKQDTETYMLFKMALNGKKAVLSEITPYVKETFNSSAELKKYVSANMDVSYFFGDNYIYDLD
jgi:hypothetical protein